MSKRKRSKNRMTFKRFLFEILLDSFALAIAIGIELAVITASMFVISPGGYVTIALVGNGFIIVLFGARAIRKGTGIQDYIVWATFAAVAVFFNISYALVTTDAVDMSASERPPIEQDERLQIIRDNLSEARNQLDRLNADFDQSAREETIDSVLASRTAIERRIDDYEQRELERIETLTSGSSSDVVISSITSSKLFYAIPDAARRGRIIELIIFTLISVGLEFSIVTLVVEEKKKEAVKKQERISFNPTRRRSNSRVSVEDIRDYVAKRWTDSGELLSRSESLSAGIHPEIFQRITAAALRAGLFVQQDNITRVAPMVTREGFIQKIKEIV